MCLYDNGCVRVCVCVCVPEQVVLDSSSPLPQSLSPSHSQRTGIQRLFWHLNLSAGPTCWSAGREGQTGGEGDEGARLG